MHWITWVVIALFCIVNYLLFLSLACRIDDNTFEIKEKVDNIAKKLNEEKETPAKTGAKSTGTIFK